MLYNRLDPLPGDGYRFIFELPAIRHIPLLRNGGFIRIEQVDVALFGLLFQGQCG